MKAKKSLIIAIIIFMLVAVISLAIVLNKGKVGDTRLVSFEKQLEEIAVNTEIKLDKNIISSKDSETAKVQVIYNGVEETEEIQIKTANPNVAKVNENNEIEAVADGKTEVIVNFKGVEKRVDVKVITPIKSISFTTTSSTVRVGKELQLKLKTNPSEGSIDTLVYSSSNDEIATVTNNGIVTGISSGKVTITVKDLYSGIEKKVELTIKK